MRETATTRLLLVRHGETDWNRAGRIQGWAPVPLNDRGRTQARRLGETLADEVEIDRLVASDLRRTRETAALLCESGIDAEPQFERAWRERDFGTLQGLTKTEIFERHPEFDVVAGADALEATPPGGESPVDLRTRVLAGLSDLRERAAGETVLVVTHGGPGHVCYGEARSWDLRRAFTDHDLTNCEVLEIAVGEELRLVDERTTS